MTAIGQQQVRPVAIVTGATRRAGIAAAIARALASDRWNLLLTGLRSYDAGMPWGSRPQDVDELLSDVAELGGRAGFHEADLAAAEAAGAIVAEAESLGVVRALVNCAAHSTRGGLLDTSVADFDRHMKVNARATVLLSAEFARRFQDEPGTGRIVNLISGPPLVGEIAYAASKGAIEWITYSAAGELAPHGITVNAIDPGPNDTGWLDPDTRHDLQERSPLGRIGQPADVGDLVAFLCSERARFITAQVLRCDGGWERLSS